MGDLIDDAIANASQPEPLQMVEVPVMIGSTGRPAVLGIPVSSPAEIMELAAWLLTGLRKHIDATAAPTRPSLVVARSIPPTRES